jgi:hypothetical protein
MSCASLKSDVRVISSPQLFLMPRICRSHDRRDPTQAADQSGSASNYLNMVLSSNLEEIAHQSESDIREYKAIFDRHLVSVGSPNNFNDFLHRLAEDAEFAADFWALTLSIQVREKGHLTHDELFTLLVISVAGPNFSTSHDQMNGLLGKFGLVLAAHNEILPAEGKSRYVYLKPDAPITPNATDLKSESGKLPSWRSTAKIYAMPRQPHQIAVSLILLSMGIALTSVITRGVQSRTAKFSEAVNNKDEQLAKSSQTHSLGLGITSAQPAGEQKAVPSGVTDRMQSWKQGDREKYFLGRPSKSRIIPTLLTHPHRIDVVDLERRCDLVGTPGLSLRHDGNRAMTLNPLITTYSEDVSRRIDLSSGVMASHLVECQAPSYPKLAKLTHVQGPVLLQAIVSGAGAVESVHAIKGPYLLRGAASNAVRTWRYKPYLVNGKAVEVATVVTVDFVLRN